MSNRLEPQDFHPVVTAALETAMASGTQFTLDAEARRNRGVFEKIWKANFLSNLWWIALGSLTCGAIGAGLGSLLRGTSTTAIQMTLGLLGFSIFWALSISFSWKLKTPEQIALVIPTLALTPVWRAYCDAVVSIYQSPSVAPDQASSLRNALNALMEEGNRLELELESQGLLGQSAELVHIQEELRLVSVRITNAPDEDIRATLTETRDLLLARAEKVGARIHSGSRSSAQLDLIRQTFLTFREEVSQSLNSTSVPDTEESELRTLLSRVQAQTEAVSQAVSEIKSLQD